jgi:hypothetical protein
MSTPSRRGFLTGLASLAGASVLPVAGSESKVQISGPSRPTRPIVTPEDLLDIPEPFSQRDDTLIRTLFISLVALEKVCQLYLNNDHASDSIAIPIRCFTAAFVTGMECDAESRAGSERLALMKKPLTSARRSRAGLLLTALTATRYAVHLAERLHGDCPDGCIRWPQGPCYCAFGDLTGMRHLYDNYGELVWGETSPKVNRLVARRFGVAFPGDVMEGKVTARRIQAIAIRCAREAVL